jgi:hypothetical protein
VSSHWDFYFKQIDGNPASVFADLGLRPTVPDASRLHLVWLLVQMREPQPNGFSSSAEAPALGDIEDTIVPLVQRFAAFAGRITTAGRREFYFYTAEPARCRAAISQGMSAHPGYRFDAGTRPDPEWSHHLASLYPSSEDMLRIRNRHLVEVLKKSGDDIAAPRSIDHWLYFATPEARSAFIRDAMEKGFVVHAEHNQPPEGKPNPYGLVIQRVDVPTRIDGVTIDLLRLARQHNGDYGDWGTMHVK